jgi:serine/threonine protein kinase/predicted negative regulator of RcsB-dependent stress response
VLHYQIIREIGTGGMGVVYEAFDTWLERTVALKFLHESQRMSLAALRAFAREAKIAAQLDHPQIGTIFALERSEAAAFLAMAYYQGQSLTDRLKLGALPLQEAQQIALEIARGLEHAHLHGVVHRDIKPSNVFLAKQPDGSSSSKILDFGLSKLGDRSPAKSKTVVGTPAYMAPEQLDGKASSKTDLWAWGAVVYEMLSGISPFERENMTGIFQAVLFQEPVPLETRVPDAPEVLITLVRQCLRKNPDERPLDASELIRALQQTTQKSLVSARVHQDHLPIPTTAFIGREHELLELEQKFINTRLLTIAAPGGMGKTRLALEYARLHREEYADGVHFIDLARLNDATLIPNAILEGLGLNSDENPKERLLTELFEKKALLLLDNFEHLIHGATFVNELLQKTTLLKMLLTSRETLGLRNEKIYSLEGLRPPTKADFISNDAVMLFTRVAQRFDAHFHLDQTKDLEVFQRILKAVYAMPLGLELASSWLRLLSLEEIAEELERNLDFLATQSPDVPERHRSMAAVFGSSWELLSHDEQKILAQLTIFRGGFDRELAHVICEVDMLSLQRLVSKSLLYKQEQQYRFHEMIRQQATLQLPEAERQRLLEKLVDECLSMTKEWYEKRQNGIANATIFAKLLKLTDQIRLALEWCLANNPKKLLEFFLVLGQYWSILSNFQEALYWREQVRKSNKLNLEEDVALETLHLRWLFMTGHYKKVFQIAAIYLPKAEQLTDRTFEAQLNLFLGQTYLNTNQFEIAKAHARKSVFLYQKIGVYFGFMAAINMIGVLHNCMNNLKKARSSLKFVIQLTAASQDERSLSISTLNLATVDLVETNTVDDIAAFIKSLEYLQQINDLVNTSECFSILGYYYITQAEYQKAKNSFQEALRISSQYQNQIECSVQILFLGFVAAMEGKNKRGTELLHLSHCINQSFASGYYAFETFAKRIAQNPEIATLWAEARQKSKPSHFSLENAVKFALQP